MKDGSYFATSYIVAWCKALENETNEDSDMTITTRNDCLYRYDQRRTCQGYETCPYIQLGQILSKTKANEYEYEWLISLHVFCMGVLKHNAERPFAGAGVFLKAGNVPRFISGGFAASR
jgi:hypothetical protein